MLLYHFCTTRLYGKISLSERDLRLARVAILSNKITGITCQHDIIYLPFCTRAQFYHFVDANKMVFYILSYICTSFFRFIDDFYKITPFRISQKRTYISCAPTFHFIQYS